MSILRRKLSIISSKLRARIREQGNKKDISFERSDAFDQFVFINKWWAHLDLNQGPIGYEPTALTTEL